MMRLLIFISLSLLSIPLIFGQSTALRLYTGLNLSDVSQDINSIKTTTGLGKQIGIDALLGNTWYFNPGIQYQSKSIKLTHNWLTDKESTLSSSGARIAFFTGYRFPSNKQLTYRLFTGPSVLIGTGAKHKENDNQGFEFRINDFHEVEWSWTLGAGVDLEHFFIDFGYEKGLTYVFRGTGKIISNAKRGTIFLTIGVKHSF